MFSCYKYYLMFLQLLVKLENLLESSKTGICQSGIENFVEHLRWSFFSFLWWVNKKFWPPWLAEEEKFSNHTGHNAFKIIKNIKFR